ncbi:type IV pilin protein [Thalassotalea litorea]|uniref:type IV pilin protein n=1 Tax=Thalassotalea litorea TaxID=2020715 RepID=UPI0014852DC5|nr:type IV pilin protein [Thalassotalea litorea]
MKATSLGFNLIELMICLLIMAIIFLIAQANFNQLWLKSQRQQALQSLYSLAAIEHELLLRTGQYQQDLSSHLSQASTRSYQFEIAVKTKQSHGHDQFIINAMAINGQQKDTECLRFSLDSSNARQAFNSEGSLNMACWQP